MQAMPETNATMQIQYYLIK